METFDELDRDVVARLGYAVARAQLLEYALIRLLEAQRSDVGAPLGDRWEQIGTWLGWTAGRLARELRVPEAVAADLKTIVHLRNRVAHRAWTDYRTARDIAQGDAAANDWIDWLSEQAERFGHAFNVVMALIDASRAAHPAALGEAEIQARWRAAFPQPLSI